MLPDILGIFFKKGKHYGHRREAGQKGQRTEKTETSYPGGTGGEGWNRPEVHRPDREGRDESDYNNIAYALDISLAELFTFSQEVREEEFEDIKVSDIVRDKPADIRKMMLRIIKVMSE